MENKPLLCLVYGWSWNSSYKCHQICFQYFRKLCHQQKEEKPKVSLYIYFCFVRNQ